MPDDKAVNVSVSLRQSQVDNIKSYVKKNNTKFRSEAAFMQHMVNEFFNKSQKTSFMLFVGYPFAFVILMLYVAISTQRLNTTLISQGLYYSDLHLQLNVFFVIGFMCLGLAIAGTYVFYKKAKGD